MYFSEYVVSERVSSLMDPLGFMKPAGVLGDQLFQQFTVLSNHPAYHGVLCVILKFLSDREQRRGTSIGREFRRAEILWGVLNAMHKSTVINIRKYARLVDDAEDTRKISLDAIPTTHPIYARLGYGTLGHYAQPSISWGLLEKDGRRLTAAGQRLAASAAVRGDVDLNEWLTRWMDGRELAIGDLQAVAERFHIAAMPASTEREVWVDLIDAWTSANPATRCLWESPLEAGLLEAADADPAQHDEYLAVLAVRYPSLGKPVRAVVEFEALSGYIQFVFDLQLAHLQYADAGFEELQGPLKQELAQFAITLARDSIPAGEPRLDAGGIFARLAASRPHPQDIDHLVCDHHVAHQRGKGVSPLMEKGQLLVRDKIDRAELGKFIEMLVQAVGPEDHLRLLRYRSRRDWHFGRCRRYHDYAYGVAVA